MHERRRCICTDISCAAVGLLLGGNSVKLQVLGRCCCCITKAARAPPPTAGAALGSAVGGGAVEASDGGELPLWCPAADGKG
jgi:hypothetical protein